MPFDPEKAKQFQERSWWTEEQLEQDFERLSKIADILRDMGFNVVDDYITKEMLTKPGSDMGFPIVSDGAAGIRASYSKHDGLKIGFFNKFQETDTRTKYRVIDSLKAEGLWNPPSEAELYPQEKEKEERET